MRSTTTAEGRTDEIQDATSRPASLPPPQLHPATSTFFHDFLLFSHDLILPSDPPLHSPTRFLPLPQRPLPSPRCTSFLHRSCSFSFFRWRHTRRSRQQLSRWNSRPVNELATLWIVIRLERRLVSPQRRERRSRRSPSPQLDLLLPSLELTIHSPQPFFDSRILLCCAEWWNFRHRLHRSVSSTAFTSSTGSPSYLLAELTFNVPLPFPPPGIPTTRFSSREKPRSRETTSSPPTLSESTRSALRTRPVSQTRSSTLSEFDASLPLSPSSSYAAGSRELCGSASTARDQLSFPSTSISLLKAHKLNLPLSLSHLPLPLPPSLQHHDRIGTSSRTPRKTSSHL